MGTVDVLETFAELLAGTEEDGAADAFYGKLCEATCRLARMDRAVIFRYDEAVRRVRAVGTHGLDLALFAGAHVTVESALIARTALERDEVVEVPAADASAVPDEYLDLVAGSLLVCAPMRAGDRWVGVILCDRGRDGDPLAPEERTALRTLGKVAALAASARIATHQQEKAGQLQQRIDLARDVHDSVIQRLFGVSLALHAEPAPLPAEERARAGTEVQEALAELRALLERPIDARKAAPAIALADEATRLGLAVRDEAPVPEGLEALAHSVLSEAVRNARKHADASAIEVTLRDIEDVWVMEVCNDGVRADAPRRPGMGLRLAALEALQAGGIVEFGPTGDGSWRVRLAVPRD